MADTQEDFRLSVEAQQAIISHMNKDHVGHMVLMCNKLKDLQSLYSDVNQVLEAEMIAVDKRGFDVQAVCSLVDNGSRKEVIHFDF
eukprot:CAMPEP_0206191960 /NCGR_PEP_ID=MMETSP0166-20121206/5665_1 /ASSEMBLY_ACC=CAM_ASM_000260 /TAXON_ID=95228 /ORGANISM="Vannella robusta, Strain DIVA3 518/3/11/1/6" /LENGTH=85 /DNA_ID=CAMNT_0053608347 /DNA_START=1 /DNA_END=255 /DNA_ORIENTATION=-